MWCLTCGLDTSVLHDVTTAVTEDRMADAGLAAEQAHLAYDGAHEPNWWPGDPGDDITASHYHLAIALDTEQGGTQMPSGVGVADQCFGNEFRTVVQRLTHSLGDLAEACPVCLASTQAVCEDHTCRSCTLYRRLTRTEEELGDLPEALLAETGFTITVNFGDGVVVRASLSRVEAAACTATGESTGTEPTNGKPGD